MAVGATFCSQLTVGKRTWGRKIYVAQSGQEWAHLKALNVSCSLACVIIDSNHGVRRKRQFLFWDYLPNGWTDRAGSGAVREISTRLVFYLINPNLVT